MNAPARAARPPIPSSLRVPVLGRFSRLVARELLLHITVACLAGLSLFVAVELVESGNLADARARALDLALLQVVGLPLILQQILGMCVLVGSLTATAALLRRQEVLAMFAAGGSPGVLLAPALLVGGLVAGLSASLTEWVAPPAHAEVATLRRRVGLPTSGQDSQVRSRAWFKGEDVIFRVEDLEDAQGRVLAGVMLLRLGDGQLRERWDIAQLTWTEGRWHARGVVRRVFDPGGALTTERLEDLTLDLAESPEDFVRSVGAPHRLRFTALRATAAARARLGQPAAEHHLELFRRFARPCALLLAVTLGAALALRLGRRPTLAAALGIGGVVGFSLWLVDELAVALAIATALPPPVAALLGPAALAGGSLLAWLAAHRHGLRS